MTAMPIGRLSAESGVKIPNIRYYEQIGLLRAPRRTAGNHRVYDEAALYRLKFIRHARELGFDVQVIRQLLEMSDEPSRSCHDADSLARAHLADIEAKISRLEALRDEVRRMLEDCAQDRICNCRVIQVLADHEQCLHERH